MLEEEEKKEPVAQSTDDKPVENQTVEATPVKEETQQTQTEKVEPEKAPEQAEVQPEVQKKDSSTKIIIIVVVAIVAVALIAFAGVSLSNGGGSQAQQEKARTVPSIETDEEQQIIDAANEAYSSSIGSNSILSRIGFDVTFPGFKDKALYMDMSINSEKMKELAASSGQDVSKYDDAWKEKMKENMANAFEDEDGKPKLPGVSSLGNLDNNVFDSINLRVYFDGELIKEVRYSLSDFE